MITTDQIHSWISLLLLRADLLVLVLIFVALAVCLDDIEFAQWNFP